MNNIDVGYPKVEKNKLNIEFFPDKKIKKYFKSTNFFVEYSKDISEVPVSILMIPLFYNLLPIAWFTNCRISFPVLTKSALASTAKIKAGMKQIHNYSELGGEISVDTLEDIKEYNNSDNSAMLFSGGVDSWCSFLSHIEEKPILCTIWGADIKLNDKSGWELVNNSIDEISQSFNTKRFVVKSNFRDMFHYFWLDDEFKKILTGNWWHDVQHGMGLTSLFAPLCYINKISILYVPGTFSEKWLQPIASEPRIDNFVKLGGTSVFHDQFDKNRMDKIKLISNYRKTTGISVPLRVCYEGTGGENCCRCEKCTRTILALVTENLDPSEFGFRTYKLDYIKDCLESKKWKFGINNVKTYQDIQQAIDFSNNYDESTKDFLEWFINFDIYELYKNKKEGTLKEKFIYILRKIKHIMEMKFL